MALTQKTKTWLQKNAPVSLVGKTALVTGANSGVGFKTAEILAYAGARVILACRNRTKAEAAREALLAEYPGASIEVFKLDLTDFRSIDAFVQKIRENRLDLDVFVNNAGVFHQPGKTTREGFDLVIGTNYYGIFYLTKKLLPYLKTLGHEVIYINTISLIHKVARIDYEDFEDKKRGRSLKRYAASKLALAKYTFALAEKEKDGAVRVYMNHPGIAITPLGIGAVGKRFAPLAKWCAPLFNSPEKAALSVPFLIARRPPAGGIAGPGGWIGGWGYPKENRVSRRVKTGAEELIGFTEREIERHLEKSKDL